MATRVPRFGLNRFDARSVDAFAADVRRVKELEASTRLMRALLDGEEVEVGAPRPARLPHHRPVPIWIATGGPRTLRMAGSVADGVFIRVGSPRANIKTSVDLIRAGAVEAGRDPGSVKLGAILHTVLVDDPDRALTSAPAAFEHVVLHPIPNPEWPDDPERGYTARVAREVLPAVRRALGGS